MKTVISLSFILCVCILESTLACVESADTAKNLILKGIVHSKKDYMALLLNSDCNQIIKVREGHKLFDGFVRLVPDRGVVNVRQWSGHKDNKPMQKENSIIE